MIEYVLNGKLISVKPEHEQQFLQENPQASLASGNQGDSNQSANVESQTSAQNPQQENTELKSVDGSLESQEELSWSEGLIEFAKSFADPDEYSQAYDFISEVPGNIVNSLEVMLESVNNAMLDANKRVGEATGMFEALESLSDYDKGSTSELIDKEIIKSYNNIDKIKAERGDTGKGFIKGLKGEGFADVIGATSSFIAGTLETMIPSILTRGLSLFPQIVAPMYTEYNATKAKALYGDNEEAIGKLVENDELEIMVPLVLGTAAVGLEKVGLEGITKYAFGKKTASTLATSLLGTMSTEGTTEWAQSGIEKFSSSIAEQKDTIQASADAWDHMLSEEGAEAFLSGFIGAGGSAAGGRAINRAFTNDTESLNILNNVANEISSLNEKKQLTKNKVARKAIQTRINDLSSKLKTYVENNRGLKNYITEEQRSSLINLMENKDDLTSQISDLQKELDAGRITSKEFNDSTKGLSDKIKSIDTNIFDIKQEAVKVQSSKLVEKVKTKISSLGLKGSIEELTSKEIEDLDLGFEKTEDGEFVLDKEGGKIKNSKSISTEYGAIIQNLDGSFKIIINKDKPAIGTAAHEFLHVVLAKTLGENQSIAAKITNALNEHVNTLKGDQSVMRSRLDRAYGDSEYYNEETITVMSESILDGTLKFDDGFFTKIGDSIRQFLQEKGFKEIELNTGKDVYNFIKDFNKSVQSDKFNKAFADVAKEGIKGSLAKEGIVAKEGVKPKANDTDSTIKKSADVKPEVDELGSMGWTKETWKSQGADLAIAEMQANKMLDGLIAAKMKGGLRDGSNDIKKDFISKVYSELTAHVKNFNPESNDSLFGWVNSQVSNKAGNVYNREYKDKSLERAVDIDATTSEGAPLVQIEADTDILMEAIDEIGLDETEVEERSRLRRDIRLDEKMMQTVRNAVIKTFGTKLPDINSKDFRKALEKAFRTELKKPLQDLMGTRSEFNLFLKNHYKAIIKALPVETLVQMERNLKPEQRIFTESRRITKPTEVDKLISQNKLPKDTNRTSGPQLHTRKEMPSISKVMAYFRGENMEETLGYKVGGSTLGTRKDKLAMELGVELAFDATSEVLQDPAVQEKRQGILDLQGVEQADNELATIAKQIDRDPTIKFSKNATGAQTKILVDYLILNANSSASKLLKDRGLISPVVYKLAKKISKKRGEVDVKLVDFDREILKDKDTLSQEIGKELRENKNLTSVGEQIGRILETFAKLDPVYIGLFRTGMSNGQGKSLFGLAGIFDKISKGLDHSTPDFVKRFGFHVDKKLNDKKVTQDSNKNVIFLVGKKKITGEEFVEFEKQKLELLVKLFTDIQKHLETNPQDAWFFSRFITDASSNGNSLFRTAATLVGVPMDSNGNLIYDESAVEEHMLPQNNVGTMLFAAALDNSAIKIKDIGKLIKAAFAQISLLETDDDLVTLSGYQSKMPDAFWSKVVPRIMDGSLDWLGRGMGSIIRYSESGINLNKYFIPSLGKGVSVADHFGVGVDTSNVDYELTFKDRLEVKRDDSWYGSGFRVAEKGKLEGLTYWQVELLKKKEQGRARLLSPMVQKQNELITKILTGEITRVQANKQMVAFTKANMLVGPVEVNNRKLAVKAINNRIKYSKSGKAKGMSTFDFDETLIIDGDNSIIATDPATGQVIEISSSDWPIKGPDLAAAGFEFDFSDFANVRGGKEGPLLQKMKNQIEKYGNKNVFVLTARQQASALPIQQWLKSKGVDITLDNITGLGKSEGSAKGEWMLQKFAEGYNDMYFVDDALPNVKAVKGVLDQLDIKSKVVQAKIKFSKDASKDFNDMLERSKGVASSSVVSGARAKMLGKKVRGTFFVPPSAEDFKGLIYSFLGKGKQGDQDLKWFKENLFDPFSKATREMDSVKQRMTEEYKAMKKAFPGTIKGLSKKIAGTDFTLDNAIRVYLWKEAGIEVPGLSDKEVNLLWSAVKADPNSEAFAQALSAMSRQSDGYSSPNAYWTAETIASDLANIVNKVNRADYLAEWIENKDLVFSSNNLNKIEAVYGTSFREALEDMLYAMETGSNRPTGKDKDVNKFLNWINGSVGAVMFFNTRSAVLQTLSTVNFLNFKDNNIFAAAKAFANQKQFWSDFSTIFNSDMLKQRRAGLKIDVSASELTEAFSKGKSKTEAIIAYLLQLGFTPTQLADSFAIAMGGSTFYRNRVKKYLKEGKSQKDAESQAFLDFQEIAEETQQSSRPDLISKQQRGVLGRIILAWANTPMQMTRLTKKALSDLVNRRGDTKANISRIIYYGVAQNIIFGTLQTGLAFLAFGAEEEEEKTDAKQLRMVNGVFDTLLRGTGIWGAAASTLKNVIMQLHEELGKGFGRKDWSRISQKIFDLSPPLGTKHRKIMNAIKTYDYNKDVIKKMDHGINNPGWNVFTNVIEAMTNAPIARVLNKAQNLKLAMQANIEPWQRVAIGLGWSAWSVGVEDQEIKEVKAEVKRDRKATSNKRSKEKKAKSKADKEKENKAKGIKSVRCSGIKSDGTRCKITVQTKNKTAKCTYHKAFKDGSDTDGDGKKEYRCKAKTSSGKQCKNRTENKSKKCYAHR